MLKTPAELEQDELSDAYAAVEALGYATDDFSFQAWCGRTQTSRAGLNFVEICRAETAQRLYPVAGKFSWVVQFEDDLICGTYGAR